MQILKLPLGPIGANTYIVISGMGKKALVIDPADKAPELLEALKNYEVPYIVNTHGHFDHIYGNQAVREWKNSQIIIHRKDSRMLIDPLENFSDGFLSPVLSPPADILVEDEAFSLSLDELKFQIICVPGHTRGSIALYCEEEKVLFPGDFIFSNTIGRMDLPGGNIEEMIQSLKKIILLPDDTHVYPGHEEDFFLSDFKPFAESLIGKRK
jgi:glyoxylase-like metal-dependent hydrolase (beta-lactamase superfamily II)